MLADARFLGSAMPGSARLKPRLPLHFCSLQLPSHWFRKAGRGASGDSLFPATVGPVIGPEAPLATPVAGSGAVLDTALRLHEALAEAVDFSSALACVRTILGQAMGARSSVCLWPLLTKDGGVLLQAVGEGAWRERQDAPCLDALACAVVTPASTAHAALDALPRALALGGVQWGELRAEVPGEMGAGSAAWPWRDGVAGQVVVMPVPSDDPHLPAAVIEWHGVSTEVPAWLPVLGSAWRCLPLHRQPAPAAPAVPAQGPGLLAALSEALPISVLVLDAATLCVQALNQHAQIELGIQRDRALGCSLGDVLGVDAQREVQPWIEEALRRSTAVEHDFTWSSADGLRQINARHVAVRDAQGHVAWLICQWRDITDRRQAERSLIESQTRFKELVESIEEGVFVSDPQRASLSYASERVLDIFGLVAARPLVAQALLARVLPDDQPLLLSLSEHERALQSTDCRLRILHPQRGLRWLRQRTRSRLLPNGEIQVVGLVDDVTDEHERAQQLQAARDTAEAASQAKSQFMATMSHEIRTPMNGILGMTELLLGTRLGERQRRFAQAVYRSAENLLEIINDVLDVAKIEAGRLEIAPTELNLRTLVEDTLELLAPRAHAKGLELSFREAPGVPLRVRADALRLRQVLTNLVANAVKFTERGEVNVGLACVSMAGDARHCRLDFTVRDTGIGIDPADAPRLFSAFNQVHGGLARRYGGTGLGLAISKQLVELMGGAISAQSRPGQGSSFAFSVPVERVQPELEEAPMYAQGLDMPRLTVLLVEDHPTTRQVLEAMLRDWGLDVVVARDAEHALSLLRERRHAIEAIDVALVDRRMPGLDGIGLARQLAVEQLQPDMKLVLLSSMSAPDDLRAARAAGFHHFVQKPVRKGELHQALLGLTRPDADVRPAPQFDCAVLVVEDNAVNQEVMSQMLAVLGCQVQLASSAEQGLRALAQQRQDVVLMDIQMPGMDGIEALQALRAGPAPGQAAWATPAQVPVIAVTANALAGDETRLRALGFDGYLAKPYRQSELLRLLLAVRGEAWQSEFAALEDQAAELAWSSLARQQFGDELPILDAAALTRLHGLDPGGQNQLFERVCKAFEGSIDRLLVQLEQSLAAHDLGGVGQVVHTLKSSSASVGAAQLAQLSAELDSRLRQGASLAEMAAGLARLGDAMRQAQVQLAARVSLTG